MVPRNKTNRAMEQWVGIDCRAGLRRGMQKDVLYPLTQSDKTRWMHVWSMTHVETMFIRWDDHGSASEDEVVVCARICAEEVGEGGKDLKRHA